MYSLCCRCCRTATTRSSTSSLILCGHLFFFDSSSHPLLLRNDPRSQDKTSNAVLQARVAALEQGDSFAATQTAVQQVQADCLRQLREIRTALGSSTTTTTTTSAPAADTLALERKVAKLEYRVQHLVSGIESLYEKQNTANVGSS
jgi:hypothetical protein